MHLVYLSLCWYRIIVFYPHGLFDSTHGLFILRMLMATLEATSNRVVGEAKEIKATNRVATLDKAINHLVVLNKVVLVDLLAINVKICEDLSRMEENQCKGRLVIS